MLNLEQKIVDQTGLDLKVVQSIIALLNEGNTVPFIARYRKEMTNGATDEQLRDFNDTYTYNKNLIARKEDVIRLIDEKGLMTHELKKEILAAETLAKVEDIYRPFKEKKNTKATIAKAKGLEPLAKILKQCKISQSEFEVKAAEFVKEDKDPKKSVKDVAEAMQGAADIVAEEVSDNAKLRAFIKEREEQEAMLVTKATKKFEKEGVYKLYESWQKNIAEIASHSYLAICRAEKDKQLSVKLKMAEDIIKAQATKQFVPLDATDLKEHLQKAIDDGLKRLLLPSIEREIRANKKKEADQKAIGVFGENLKNLLLTAPVKGKTILGFDPAYRTGCKLAVIDQTGKFLYNNVIYPTAPQEDTVGAEKELIKIINQFGINLIVIGNGTASRESEKFVSDFLKKNKLKEVQYLVTSEAGASVYSASKLAQEEYPDLDVTVRGAISIAQRIQDPLATFVKIDPKSIGIGQYQHDVDQKFLKQKLEEKIEDTVNKVGVDANTASWSLLQHIAGLSSKMAQNFVQFREDNGQFSKRSQFKKVAGLGPKAYEQAVGFLRIKEGKEVLDKTGIHPDHYAATYEILEKEFNLAKKKLTLPLSLEQELGQKLDDNFVMICANNYEIGEETLRDIFSELESPGLDPRVSVD